MANRTVFGGIALGVIWLSVAFVSPAHAYLDPGMGSYVTQVAFATLIGLSLSFRSIWTRIKGFMNRRSSKPR